MHMTYKSLFIMMMLLVGVYSANANLIVNGDFSSSLSGWSVTLHPPSAGFATSTEYFMGYDNDGWGILSQTITTIPGQEYDISFDTFSNLSSPSNEFAWTTDGGLNYVPLTTSWSPTVGSFTAIGATTDVEFYFKTDLGTGSWNLDNVSVEAIPEPASLALIGVIGCGAFGIRRFFLI